MLKRTIYIQNPSYLKLKHQQMVVQCPKTKTIKGTVPIEDMALLFLDHHQITISNALLIALQGNTVALISCDAQHLPFALTLPLYGHTEHSERVKHQIQASIPLKKQLWRQTVQQKIKNQSLVLAYFNKPYAPMQKYYQEVKSGDSTQLEGVAAKYYWQHLFTPCFYRDRAGGMPNNLLNFGYAVLRSMVARALVSSGLLPVLGIFHKNKYNPYCLADDVMEPYRPFVDRMVKNYIDTHTGTALDTLTPDIKQYLLGVATTDVSIDGLTRPLMVALTTTTASLYKCYTTELRQIKYPEVIV